MNDRVLQQQIDRSGDLMDVLDDPAILGELIQVEIDHKGDIGAGFPAYSRDPKPVTPEQAIWMRREVRLQSLVMSEFAEMLRCVNLGAGREAAICEGRRRIRAHLVKLTEEQQRYFEALVDEDQQQTEEKPIRAQLRTVLRELLSEAEWGEIVQLATASIQAQWSEFLDTTKSA
jgi:hypothetical protein